jgi:hypothetical protein
LNEIVKRGYPLENLPEDIRREIPAGSEVDVTVTVHAPKPRLRLAELVGIGPNVHGDADAVLDHISRLREER